MSNCLKQAAPLLLPIISSDAMLLLASYAAVNHGSHAGIAAVVACGLKFTVALAAIAFQKRYKERLTPWQAAVGDVVEVHVTVSTASGAAIDTTRGKRPLAFTVGQAAAGASEDSGGVAPTGDAVAAVADTSSSSHSDAASGPSSAPPLPGGRGGGGWGGEGGGSMSAAGSRGVLRFRSPAFAALLDELTPGLVVGERRRVTVHNPAPKDGGFLNPGVRRQQLSLKIVWFTGFPAPPFVARLAYSSRAPCPRLCQMSPAAVPARRSGVVAGAGGSAEEVQRGAPPVRPGGWVGGPSSKGSSHSQAR